jgi:hypothetical protein
MSGRLPAQGDAPAAEEDALAQSDKSDPVPCEASFPAPPWSRTLTLSVDVSPVTSTSTDDPCA